ncbi:hypothetical protein [Pseudalkalibacillus sp. SCS-8]|uniref:hypothetical protein n=1 Tax=Pseudalkalibacillus nanhaiensis TaxID=3115291 RepID=UPI0032DB9448
MMFDHKQEIPLTHLPIETESKNANPLNDSVMDYQNGAVHSDSYGYDYSLAIPLDQVPYRPHNE